MKLAIYGYGNLGKGVEAAIGRNGDMELVGIFTRRSPDTITPVTPNIPVLPAADLEKWAQRIDVLLLCGGSATDLPAMTPALARQFHVVDSYDNHSRIPVHYENVEIAAKETNHVALISCGWDPGLFSLSRVYAQAVLPDGDSYTFWDGVSQGHSDAIRRIPGVVDARQYTVPVPSALEQVRAGQHPQLTARQKHNRVCYVAVEEGADRDAITRQIVTMPGYFADYDTTVHFISLQELREKHGGLPHGGSVIRTGSTGTGKNQHRVEFSLKLDSNPEFTGSVLTACARAVYRLSQQGDFGCKTIFDIPPALLSPMTREELLATTL